MYFDGGRYESKLQKLDAKGNDKMCAYIYNSAMRGNLRSWYRNNNRKDFIGANDTKCIYDYLDVPYVQSLFL